MLATLRSTITREAVAAAFAAFAPGHPDYVESLFDEHFLQTRVGAAAANTWRRRRIYPEWLARAWVAQFGGRGGSSEQLMAEAIPVAADFIDQLIRAFAPPSGSLLALYDQEVLE